MGVELTIRIVPPLDDHDRELLAGVAVMILAITNHALVEEPPAAPSRDEQTADWTTSARPKIRPIEPVQ